MDLNAQFENLSSRNVPSKPMLIDFGGISYYQCNPTIPPKTQNNQMKTLFNAWKNYLDIKSKQNEQDIERILKCTQLTTTIFYWKWKDKYQANIMQRKREYFKIWTILTKARLKEKEQLKQKSVEVIIYWKNLAMRRVFSIHSSKRLKKRFFNNWKKVFQNQQRATKIKRRVNKVKLKRFMKLWKNRYRIHSNKAKEKQTLEALETKMIRDSFDYWRLLYIRKTLKGPKENRLKQQFFLIWRTNLMKSKEFHKNFQAVVEKRNSYLLSKAFFKICHKYKLSQNKKKKKKINLWARLVIREITYSRTQYIRAQILKRAAFRQMKNIYEKRMLNVKREFFNIFKQYTEIQKKKKKCRYVCMCYTISRYFGRWQTTYKGVTEKREINFVIIKVVNIHIKRRAFNIWLNRAIEVHKLRQIIAIKFRKRQIKSKYFNAWHNFSVMKTIRAEEYFKTIVLNKCFKEFVYQTLELPRQKEQKAMKFYNTRLQKKYFERFKSLKHADALPDDNLDEIIGLLNGNMYV